MVLDVNVLTNPWTIAGVFTTVFIAFVALFIGLYSNWRINKIRKAEKKERIIKQIVEWAMEIHTTGLRTEPPGIDPSLELTIEALAKGNREILENMRESILNSQYKSLEFARLFKYVTALSINVYIKALASKCFKGNNLIGSIDLVTDSLTAFIFLKGKSLGLDMRKSLVGGGMPKIFDRLENELKPSSIDNVLKRYSIELSDSINALFVQSANIISNL